MHTLSALATITGESVIYKSSESRSVVDMHMRVPDYDGVRVTQIRERARARICMRISHSSKIKVFIRSFHGAKIAPRPRANRGAFRAFSARAREDYSARIANKPIKQQANTRAYLSAVSTDAKVDAL